MRRFRSRWTFELGIRPLLASLPKGFHLASEMLPGFHLMTHNFGLGLRNKTGLRAAAHAARETEVRAVAGLGVVGTATAGLVALNVAFGE